MKRIHLKSIASNYKSQNSRRGWEIANSKWYYILSWVVVILMPMFMCNLYLDLCTHLRLEKKTRGLYTKMVTVVIFGKENHE